MADASCKIQATALFQFFCVPGIEAKEIIIGIGVFGDIASYLNFISDAHPEPDIGKRDPIPEPMGIAIRTIFRMGEGDILGALQGIKQGFQAIFLLGARNFRIPLIIP